MISVINGTICFFLEINFSITNKFTDTSIIWIQKIQEHGRPDTFNMPKNSNTTFYRFKYAYAIEDTIASVSGCLCPQI